MSIINCTLPGCKTTAGCKCVHTVAPNDDVCMRAARRIVEDHIEAFGWVPHPDHLKDAIAGALRRSAIGAHI